MGNKNEEKEFPELKRDATPLFHFAPEDGYEVLPVFIGNEKENRELYRLEKQRNEIIEACAKEWGKLTKNKEYWKQQIPTALYDVLGGWDHKASELAAKRFLQTRGYKVEKLKCPCGAETEVEGRTVLKMGVYCKATTYRIDICNGVGKAPKAD